MTRQQPGSPPIPAPPPYRPSGATKNTATTTIGSSITNVGDLTVSGGTLTLNNASALSMPTLTTQLDTPSGTASSSLTGKTMTLIGGPIGGTITPSRSAWPTP